jgi:hypothetical protein
MSYHKLTQTQKSVLKWIVEQVNTGVFREDFTIKETLAKDACVFITPEGDAKRIKDIRMSIGALTALAENGFLTCTPRFGQTRGMDCTLTAAAYEVVKHEPEPQADIDEIYLQAVQNIPAILCRDIPECDEVIIRYAEEAVSCIIADAWLAATVMVGAASEKAILLLIDTYADAITNEAARERFKKKTDSRWISKKFEVFKQSYQSCKNRPRDRVLSEGFGVAIESTFQFCRITRNEVGHPEIVPTFEKSEIIANLNHILRYIKLIYELMHHFQENGVTV